MTQHPVDAEGARSGHIRYDSVPSWQNAMTGGSSIGTSSVHVLLSGGIDSATVLASICAEGSAGPAALFIDYGQPTACREAEASAAIATHYGVVHRSLELRGFTPSLGEVRGRNAFFVHVALMILGQQSGVIAIGIHAETGYRDCSPAFGQLMSESLEFHTDGAVGLATPLLTFSKLEVLELARALGVPLGLTYSCEVANRPCASCRSCKDREVYLAGA